MPNGMFSLDDSFPQFTGQETDKQRTDAIYDYLIQLQQTLRYCLQNLGGDNFNDTELEAIGNTIREPVNVKLKGVDEDISALKLKAEGLTLEVKSGKGTLELTLKSGEAVLSTQKITFDGVVTFTAETDGYSRIDGGLVRCEAISAEHGDFGIAYIEGDGSESTRIAPGTVAFADHNVEGTFIGSVGANSEQMSVESYGVPLKIISSGGVTIGSEGHDVHLSGNVYVNGKLIE